jgi:hypothetical protein
MTSFIDQNKVDILIEAAEAPAQGLSTMSRSMQGIGIRKGPRVVRNKAQDLASQGSAPWDNAHRQALIDSHALFETWEPVAEKLDRSNQALRSEWNKMKIGQREKEGNWQEKVKVCEAQREILDSTKRSGNRHTTTITPSPAANTQETDISGTSSRTAMTTRSPDAEISSSTTLNASPDVETNISGSPTGLYLLAIAADLHSMGTIPRQSTRGLILHRSRS